MHWHVKFKLWFDSLCRSCSQNCRSYGSLIVLPNFISKFDLHSINCGWFRSSWFSFHLSQNLTKHSRKLVKKGMLTETGQTTRKIDLGGTKFFIYPFAVLQLNENNCWTKYRPFCLFTISRLARFQVFYAYLGFLYSIIPTFQLTKNVIPCQFALIRYIYENSNKVMQNRITIEEPGSQTWIKSRVHRVTYTIDHLIFFFW